MLTSIYINNLAIVESIELELHPGMTTITGETGAGKSILLDALELVLGAKGDAKLIRPGAQRCEIIASFAIKNLDPVIEWLSAKDLDHGEECIIRRIITVEGNSSIYLNGQKTTQQQIREIGALLVNIHGQHEHQTLLKKEIQRQLVDEFAGHKLLLVEIKTTYQQLSAIDEKLQQLQHNIENFSQQQDFLNYQIQELESLDLQPDELEQLEREFKQLSHADNLLQDCQQAITIIDDECLASLTQTLHYLQDIKHIDAQINGPLEMVANAEIQLQEALSELRHYYEKLELDPERLQWVEQRLNSIHDLARKHRVPSEHLLATLTELHDKVAQLNAGENLLHELTKQKQQLLDHYHHIAKQLTESRQKAAKQLAGKIEKVMTTLGLADGKFVIACDALGADKISPSGLDKIEFLVNTNPGQALQPLAKVVSGGELSRISLAIQTITAQKDVPPPTLIFDEVDVGVGGSTAAIIGHELKKLSHKAQVLCITHLPQVAAQGHQQLKVEKQSSKNSTQSKVRQLTAQQRIDEIARMLGGLKITSQTLAHAKEMLQEPS